jgi:L-ascorbate metabolism protein UlaG (beta-lactamase superfamily)
MKITYIGHATLLIEYGDMNVITDPMFSKRIAFSNIKRHMAPKPKFEQLPEINVILISHWHFDHLDKRTMKRFSRDAKVLINVHLGKIPRRLGFTDVRALEWWESTTVGRLKITSVPAFHFSGRPPFFTRKNYCGFVIEADGEKTVYFAGDTGLNNNFAEIGRRFDVHVAILPIGAYKPKSFRKHHLSPEDALEAKRIMGAKILVPCHWGAFNLSWEPMDEPPERLMKAARKEGIEKEVAMLNPGESVATSEIDT